LRGRAKRSPRLAVIAKAHFETVRLPLAPAFVQRAALAIGDLLGRLAGYQPTYAGRAELASA
jgi:hypothetical protein